MEIRFIGLATEDVVAIRAGGPDAYGNPPERFRVDGPGHPCRHCLRDIADGEAGLVLAWRPFRTLNPYAETGPIFLCAAECAGAEPSAELPEVLNSSAYILRGYDRHERIVYGTGGVVARGEIIARARELLALEGVEFVDVRSAANNCFQCRVVREG